MGKSSTSLKHKHSKNSLKSKSSSKSKSRKHKSKKVRRCEVSLSSSDYDDSKSLDTSLSSSSEDRSKRKRDRSRTRKDVKSRKKRARRRSSSRDSSEDSVYAKKRKKLKRKNKYDERKEKSRRKKRVKREASVSSKSSESRSCSPCPGGVDGNDNIEYESSRGRTERKEKDKRRSRGRSGNEKSGRYRPRSCSPCGSPRGECSYEGTEDKYVSENKSRRLRSVITVAKEEDESRELSINETKEEIVDDLDYPCRSNDSNDGGTKRESDDHTHPAPEEVSRPEDETEDMNADVNFTEPNRRDMSSLKVSSVRTNESIKNETSDTSGANLNDVDLESILRQRALENLRKFRGQVQSAAKASEQKNKIVSQVKQPVSDKEELVQDKPNISDVAIATKSGKQTLVEETSLPVGRRNLVASPRNSGRNLNLDKNISGSAKIQIACAPEKVIDADNQSKVVTESTNTITGNLDSTPSESCHDSLQSRSSLKRSTVSGLPHEKLVLAESIKNKGSNDNVKDIRGMPSAGGKPSIAGTTSSIDGPTFKHNNLDKGQDGAGKVALNNGMSNYVLVVYRHAVAFIVIVPFAVILEKKVRPKMTLSIFMKLVILSVLEPVIDQNLYFLGMKYTTATFAVAMFNVLPAITFVVAWILKLEKIKMKSIHSQAKIVGTVATVAGAMLMTLLKGPILNIFGIHGSNAQIQHNNGANLQHAIKGSIMITIGCFSCACFMILQAITLETYPAELSLTAWICLLGTIEGGIVALIMERGEPSVWSLNWDTKLLAAVYSGIVCSGMAYYIQGAVMRYRGPVFVTTFNPLCMVIVAIMGSFFLAEKIYLGRVIGAVVIIFGLYLVVWGKSKDYDTPTPNIEDENLAAKQITEINDKEEHPNHEVMITSKTFGEGNNIARDEQV